MQCDARLPVIVAAFLLAFGGIAVLSSDSDATDYDKDLGSFWSYTVQFVFNGEQAQSIEWDFGDETEVSTEWNPKHTFPDKGEYYVQQKVTNSKGTSTETYKVTIMGFPYVTLVYGNGAGDGTIQQTRYNEPMIMPEEPVRDGHSFTGWFTDSGCTIGYDWEQGVTSPITLYAGWEENEIVEHTVSFDIDGGSVPMESVTVSDGASFTFPAYSGVKDGYIFGEWEIGGTGYAVGDTFQVTSDVIVKAVWTVRTYTVTFDPNGGSAVESVTVEHGSIVEKPNDPVRSGYTFARWELNGEKYTFDSPVTSDITLKARWKAIVVPVVEHTVSFNPNGGSQVPSQTVRDGSKAVKPEDPVREGHTFDGWFLGNEKYDFTKPVTSDIKLTAQWTSIEFTVSFDTDGGSEMDPQTVPYGLTVSTPDEPTREGFTFQGWYLGDELYDFQTPVMGDITLTAHWTEIEGPVGPSEDENGNNGPMLAIIAIVVIVIILLAVLLITRL